MGAVLNEGSHQITVLRQFAFFLYIPEGEGNLIYQQDFLREREKETTWCIHKASQAWFFFVRFINLRLLASLLEESTKGERGRDQTR